MLAPQPAAERSVFDDIDCWSQQERFCKDRNVPQRLNPEEVFEKTKVESGCQMNRNDEGTTVTEA
jgi:hypothetical protein